MPRRLVLSLLAVPFVLLPQPADLILRNGRIVTMDDKVPRGSSVAIGGDRVLAVGSDAAIAKLASAKTKIIDLNGRLAIPGFIEGHGHFMGIGEFRLSLNLREARNWDDIVEQVGRAAKQAKPGEWIVGRGWHQSKWNKVPERNTDGFPVHVELSRVSPNNPVALRHASGHATFVNEAALKAAGITAATPDPAGGHVMKDAAGKPTGLLQETASGLISKAMNDWRARRSHAELREEALRIVDLASEECLSKGITSFQDAGSPFEVIALVRSLAEEGTLKLRLWMMLRAPNAELATRAAEYRIIGAGNNMLTVRAVKRAIDGALGPRGAWLLEPYADLPPGSPNPAGLNTDDPAEIRKTAEICLKNGLQLCVHAIGDRANRETLDIFEQAFKTHPERKDLRWRVEHAQHLSSADVPRFGKLGVIAAMQGIHCTSDAPYVLARLGPKRAEEGAYVWQKLLRSGAVVANGTDAPVEDVSPLASFYASVSRKLKDGSRFYPDQRMSRMEALRSYTVSNAYAAFEENLKGSLAPGKLADITVLSRDILTIPEDDILLTDVVYTIVGGAVRYENRAVTGR